MRPETKRVGILRICGEKSDKIGDVVVREFPLTIILNNVELVSLLCSPQDVNFLAVGFLFAEGVIRTKREIKRIYVDKAKGVVWINTKRKKEIPENFVSRRFITTGCGKGISLVDPLDKSKFERIESSLKIPAKEISTLMKEFQQRSETHRLTGGVHSAALCDEKGILVFNEDIGRHSAIDKVLGECLMKGIKTRDRFLVTSGRVSSEILLKAVKAKVPIVISKSAPTDLGIRLANKLGITMIGFARGSRMNVYSNFQRIQL